VAIFLSLTISRPLRRLTEAAGRIAAGERGVALNLRGRDELGELARDFDAMARALEGAGDTVLVAPGNGGTPGRRAVDPCAPAQVVALCREENIDLIVIGPESALAAGVSVALREAGFKVFVRLSLLQPQVELVY
jgi:HAMP domain-containing protein